MIEHVPESSYDDEELPFAPETEKPKTKELLVKQINDMLTKKSYYINGGVTVMMEDLKEASGGRTTSINQFKKEELEKLYDIVNGR